MTRVDFATSVAAIGAAAWSACLPDEIEGYAYHRAVEAAGLEGFELLWAVARDGERVLGFAPAFVTSYRLDATLQGPWKRITQAVARIMPSLLRLRMTCLGSPAAETCAVGLAPQLDAAGRRQVLSLLLQALRQLSRDRRAGLIAIKDLPEISTELSEAAGRAGFQRLPGLPMASLELAYPSFEAYLASLSPATRKDMRRKLKAAGAIVVERRTSVDDVLPRMVELYAGTRARSDLQFETLPPAYFTGVLSGAGEGASCFLYWHGPELLAFNLVLHDERRLVDKFFCMNAEQGRRFNLYFLSWMTNVRFCLERGIKLFVSGQAAYGPKLRLGSKLNPNWLFFRHRNRLIHAALRLAAAFLRVDRHDPVLSALAKDRDAVPGEWRRLQHQ
ncbi:GNAT family N-acetyltransferase [Vineibacter terrae]|uniref:GNAT family N-acetyltransferase n=1 Tax=Vineibacter terrae TaxID=2586908 RepID=UPI002E380F62|nr:GNAT family N-acetyltransferase [Vineibacter terrae]HEX2887067.1 GNAT family N-acetyltransferase [Vineibacter terrae]